MMAAIRRSGWFLHRRRRALHRRPLIPRAARGGAATFACAPRRVHARSQGGRSRAVVGERDATARLTGGRGFAISSGRLRVHFIAIAGTGMGALARLLKEAGHDVRGSDVAVYPPMSEQLARAEIPVMLGFDAGNLDWNPDCVVVGNVCSKDHVEVVAAQARGLPLESFPSLLARTLLADRDSLVVAGTHGKTTTTSIVAWLLRCAGSDPSFLVGGVPLNFGQSAHLGQGRALVLEGDEYDTAFFDKGSKFLHYRPKRAILTSVEYDHADIFADLAAVRAAFVAFVATIPEAGELVVNAEDPEALGVAATARCRVTTYRVLPDTGDHASAPSPDGADYCARVLPRGPNRRTAFEVFERGQSLGEMTTQLLGRFNIANLLAAIALARGEGVDVEAIRAGVRSFRGVKRRQELVGLAEGVRVMSDFAHHPTAVQLTVTAVRKAYPEQALHVCFEPRSASSRRKRFGDAFAASFDAATAVYLGPLYQPHKVPQDDRLDTTALAKAITARGPKARAFAEIDALADAVVDAASPGDTVLLLSSGSFGGLAERVLFGFGDPVTFGAPEDAAAIDALLDRYELPPISAGPDVETLVMRSPSGIAGAVSLQVAGDDGFLFGLAVVPERRGQGLGWVLGDSAIRRGRELGLARIFLLTNTASDFFAAKLGFSPIAADAVDAAIRRRPNFTVALAQPNAVCMVLPLDDSAPRPLDENVPPS
ncbi:MAG TPA: GNAT family N-acetyltransferase [Nannocystaceae bacterium]|nr:GNAT family N-acetyltransferase [Nannocystaceae bacterium]